jgi:ubiquinone/menaquinone biosynthesis C-methylase UbiE
MSPHNDGTVKYFAEKAEKYDDVDSQAYWVFSDSFYKEVLKRELAAFFSNHEEVRVLDAGAGTGRWTIFLHELFGADTKLTGHLVDISPEMLEVAKRKLNDKGLNKDFTVSVGDIEVLSSLADESFDLSISFYNVLSFVDRPEKALGEIRRVLKKGGLHLSIVANSYHSLYFAVLTGRTKEIDRVQNESKIAFNDLMPPIHCFTPNALRELYLGAGYEDAVVYGGPNFIYPGMEETFIAGNTSSIQSFLETDGIFQKLMTAELANYRNTDVSGRANTLLAIGRK